MFLFLQSSFSCHLLAWTYLPPVSLLSSSSPRVPQVLCTSLSQASLVPAVFVFLVSANSVRMAGEKSGQGACRGLGCELPRALTKPKTVPRACTAERPHIVFDSPPGTATELPAPSEQMAGASGRRWGWMRGSNRFPL